MVDWTSPEELAKESLVFDRLMHTLIGLYTWEWIISLDFDWQFISRRKRFHWPMIFYFLNRYCMLFATTGIAVMQNLRRQVNCQVLSNITITVGACAIGFASINLSLRTMAVWSRKWYIVAPLVVIILGHFGLILHVVTLKSTWIDGKGCVITFADNAVLGPTFIYTVAFDFIILSLTAIKLFQTNSSSRSRLRNLIFRDGLIYFIVAFVMNVLTTTLILLDLNPIMSVISNVPAVILSTIVACRVVRRLNDYSSSGPETFAMAAPGSSLAFSASGVRHSVSTILPRDEDVIHVQMDTFPSSSDSEAKTTTLDSPEVSQVDRNKTFDLESQRTDGEFKHRPIVPPSP